MRSVLHGNPRTRGVVNAANPHAAVLVPVERKTRKPGVTGLRPIAPGSTVQCRCWCERRNVDVPIEDVSHGLTGTCGRAGCAAP
jgi:hypothetical protein